MKKLLYLHGLNSTLHDDRKAVLSAYEVEIIAPQMDYEGNPELWDELISTYNVDVVIGSSAGGLAGFYFSGVNNIPALLFNPALPFRHYMKAIPEIKNRDQYLQIVIGARDEEVPALKSFEFLRSGQDKSVPMEIHWINQMEHSLPIEIFEREVACFMEYIGIPKV